MSGKLAVLESTHSKGKEAAKRCSMSTLALVDQNGRTLTDDKPATPAPVVENYQQDDPLHVIAARQHAKDSTRKDTNKPHSFTLHHTYSGPGCAICGKEESSHP